MDFQKKISLQAVGYSIHIKSHRESSALYPYCGVAKKFSLKQSLCLLQDLLQSRIVCDVLLEIDQEDSEVETCGITMKFGNSCFQFSERHQFNVKTTAKLY